MQIIKPEERHSEADIILNDEEIDPIIRELIAKAFEKGYRKSNVAKAVVARWDELCDPPKPVFSPTSEESEFWEKAAKFVQTYRDLLIEAYDEDVNNVKFNIWCKGDEEKEKRVLRKVEVFLCASYCTFCREDNIRKAYVEKYAKLIQKSDFSGASITAEYVYKVIGYKLRYDKDNQYKPERDRSKEGLVYFHNVETVDEFCDQYRYTHTKLSNAIMAAIWFINTYIS